jgi:hypothetical protein
MNKELLITLIKKDVNELGIVLEGLLENNNLPKSIINLSIDKAENIASCLKQLLEENAQIPQTQTCTKEEICQEGENNHTQSSEEDVVVNIEVKEMQEDVELVSFAKEDVIEIKEESSATDTSEQEVKEVKIITVAESVQVDVSLNEKLQKEDNSIGNIISSQKIEDLKQAISIGDRFRFQRELFGGNGEIMNKTITELNNATSLEKALEFISTNFSWNEKDDNVKDFLSLLERKFIN